MRKKIVICGGGTGGHFFCGLAFAEKYLEQNPRDEVLFIGVRTGIEGRYKFDDPRMRIEFVKALGFKNLGIMKKFDSLISLSQGLVQAIQIIWREKPWLILGVGGYSSIPGVLAGFLLKVFRRHRVAIVEQNSVPGISNLIFSKLPIEAYSAFPYKNFVLIELPMRKKVEDNLSKVKPVNWPPQQIVVTGGSQGAQGLNQAWISLLPSLHEAFPNLRIVHQAGKLGLDYVRSAYENLGMEAEVFDFSDRLGEYLSQADLVISRAGALSIFELMAYSRPVVFVPFPQAADDHQFKNAEAVQSPSWIIAQHELRWERLKEILESPKALVLSWKKGFRASWRRVLQLRRRGV